MFIEDTEKFNENFGTTLQVRIGLNTGPVTSGVIGKSKFAFDIWGDSVNVASRMESVGEPGCLTMTRSTYEQVKEFYEFEGPVLKAIKGKGNLNTWSIPVSREQINRRDQLVTPEEQVS